MDEDEVEIDIDWEGWNDFVELDQTEEREEDWDYDDEDARIISALLRESLAADIMICLACGEVLAHCGCD
jgi:hypothetical protein